MKNSSYHQFSTLLHGNWSVMWESIKGLSKFSKLVEIEGKIVSVSKHCVMNIYGGMKIKLHTFLTSVLERGEWTASCSGCFTPREGAPSTHCIGGWLGTWASLYVTKRKISACAGDQTLVVKPVIFVFSDWAILVHSAEMKTAIK